MLYFLLWLTDSIPEQHPKFEFSTPRTKKMKISNLCRQIEIAMQNWERVSDTVQGAAPRAGVVRGGTVIQISVRVSGVLLSLGCSWIRGSCSVTCSASKYSMKQFKVSEVLIIYKDSFVSNNAKGQKYISCT